MSTSYFPSQNSEVDHILRPRPIKPGNPMVLRAQSKEGTLKPNGTFELPVSGTSSGRSTPLPADAPPSAQSISSARKQVREQQKHRLFPTIDYSARVSHFDPKSDYRDFRGFFVLFWIGLAIMVLTTMLRNIKDTGYPMRIRVWALLGENTLGLGFSDLAMVGSTVLSLPLQWVFRRSKGWLRWERYGMPIQSIFQIGWLVLWVNWPFMLDWTWTAQVFFTLHTLVFLMKMHSYAFYNGHLSTTEHRLSALDNPATASTVAAVRYPSSSTNLDELDTAAEEKKYQDDKEALSQLREDLALELTSPLGHVTYPQNLSAFNYVDYILCPTLCYELEYPRTANRQWMELFYKTLAVFGCIFLLTITSEEFIVPVLNDSALKLEGVDSLSETGLILAESISMLLFPFMVTFLLVFLVIFEYILGAFAEITCFADRHFYSDWWNSCDWLEFSREWNIPVHHFLRRHVYGASRPHVSRNMATLITFLISAFGHELVMGCITKKLRGYGFVAQMMQLPIVALQRTKFVKGRRLFNNVLFWISMILGLAMVASSLVDETFALAASSIQSIYTNLPPSLQSHLTSASAYLHRTIPPSLIEQAASLLARTTPEILIATLLPLLILVFSMSWPSRFWPSGRYSPFGAPAGHTPPTVTEDDYHYLGPDDIVDPPRQSSYGFPSQSRNATRIENNSSLSPDILNLRHRGTTYPLHFPAYAIADGGLRVGDLRRIAAKETKAEDPRRVKLLYKGKTLKDDARACREEGLKQNSELMCVVSEASPMEAESSESADEDEMLNGAGGPRIDVDGTVIPQRKRKGHRGGRKKKGSGSSTPREGVPPRDSRFLAPDRTGSGASTSRSNSPMRPSQPPPSKKIQSPSEKLDELSRTFHTVFVPKCVHFTANPPSDSKARDLEYKKLSESLLAQIMLKCDAVETEGDEGLRGRRKELVREVQAMLNNLDWVGKRGY